MYRITNLQPDKPIRLTGVILAGGQNRRMNGKHKASLTFGSEKLIERQLRMMKQICKEIIIVANVLDIFHPLIDGQVKLITDEYPGKGPLAGMHAGMTAAEHSHMWVVGCDMPFLSVQAALLMRDLLEAGHKDAVIPLVDGRFHPLHGLYRRQCAELIPPMLDEGQYRVGEFLQGLACEVIEESEFRKHGIDLNFVINVNTPEEYERALVDLDQ